MGSGRQVEAQWTTATDREAISALSEAHEVVFGMRPTRPRLLILAGQSALETARWQKMRNYNVGGIKASPSGRYDYASYPTHEVLDGKRVSIYAHFRAYPTLAGGFADWLTFLAQPRFATALARADEGHAEAYARELKAQRYYTADEVEYARGVSGLAARFARERFDWGALTSGDHVQSAKKLLDGLGSPGAHFLDEAELRRRVAALYASHEGWRSTGETEDDYETLLFPHDRPEWRRRAADEMWSCALRFLAVCRLLGVRHPVLEQPYEQRVGQAVADVRRVAEAHGAIVSGEALGRYEPEAGDALCSVSAGGGEHVSCVSSATWLPRPGGAPALVLDCVDGGQGGRGAMAIEANRYLWTPGALQSVEAPRSLDNPGPARRLVFAVSLWRLALGAGLLEQA